MSLDKEKIKELFEANDKAERVNFIRRFYSVLKLSIAILNFTWSDKFKNDFSLSSKARLNILKNNFDEIILLENSILKNRHVSNVAISGPYGSGKSSFLDTFKATFSEHKYINLSLANFLEADGTVHDLNEEKMKLLEESIVQHILYKENPSKTSLSRIQRIPFISFLDKFLFSMLIVIFAPLFYWQSVRIGFVENTKIQKIITSEFINNYGVLIDVVSVIFFFVFIYYISENVLSFDLKRVFVKKAGISDGDNKSPLNAYLDEIIYFFHKTKYDVVIFEDLDRFGSVRIFTKLREVNSIINESSFMKNRKVSFIYAVRDDLLSSQERTKFFDLIIPIIPVVSYRTSSAALRNELEELKTRKDNIIFSERFVNNICVFINDMRVIKNIAHEYGVYFNKLNGNESNHEKILGMITFKNVSPNKYGELLHGEGEVKYFFDCLGVSKRNYIERLALDIEALEEDKEKYLNSKKFVFKEFVLGLLYKSISEITSFSNIQHIRLDFVQYDLEGFLSDEEIIEKIIRSDKQYFKRINNNYSQREEEFHLKKELLKRSKNIPVEVSAIGKNIDDKVIAINRKIEDIMLEISETKSKKISDFLNVFPFEEVLKDNPEEQQSFKWLNGQDPSALLVRYLIASGHLGEDYQNFTSEFIEGYLTVYEVSLISKMKAKVGISPRDKFEKIEYVLKELEPSDFSYLGNFNFQIVSALFDSEVELKNYLSEMKKSAKLSPKEFLDNLLDMYSEDNDMYSGAFINKFINYESDFFVSLLESYDRSNSLIKLAFLQLERGVKKVLFDKLGDKTVDRMALTEDLSNLFFSYRDLDLIKNLDVNFTSISYADDDILSEVVRLKMYTFSNKNMSTIASNLLGESQFSYALISSRDDDVSSYIKEYIEEDFNLFFDEFYSDCDRIYENEDFIVHASKYLRDDNLETLASKSEIFISDFRKLESVPLALSYFLKHKKLSIKDLIVDDFINFSVENSIQEDAFDFLSRSDREYKVTAEAIIKNYSYINNIIVFLLPLPPIEALKLNADVFNQIATSRKIDFSDNEGLEKMLSDLINESRVNEISVLIDVYESEIYSILLGFDIPNELMIDIFNEVKDKVSFVELFVFKNDGYYDDDEIFTRIFMEVFSEIPLSCYTKYELNEGFYSRILNSKEIKNENIIELVVVNTVANSFLDESRFYRLVSLCGIEDKISGPGIKSVDDSDFIIGDVLNYLEEANYVSKVKHTNSGTYTFYTRKV